MLEEALEVLKDAEPKTAAAGSDTGARTVDDLQKQAADLEKTAKELREKIEALKVKPKNDKATKSFHSAASN